MQALRVFTGLFEVIFLVFNKIVLCLFILDTVQYIMEIFELRALAA